YKKVVVIALSNAVWLTRLALWVCVRIPRRALTQEIRSSTPMPSPLPTFPNRRRH
ncbi:hypothetical protein SK128_009193, partial [Halocaridina rubra]